MALHFTFPFSNPALFPFELDSCRLLLPPPPLFSEGPPVVRFVFGLTFELFTVSDSANLYSSGFNAFLRLDFVVCKVSLQALVVWTLNSIRQ